MTTPRKILNQFVADHLGDVLRAGGLRKNRDRWVWVEDGNIAGIEFHANRYNCPKNIQFCPNMYTICAAFLRMEGREPDPSMGSINAAFSMPLVLCPVSSVTYRIRRIWTAHVARPTSPAVA
ncbi:MAG: hypothetical protein IT450_09170 [Phycisphaerales bacterium]|nr:hypothetical protein [Phycisphaerales bacterium]